jgi:PAS domain S-box-containing protein
VDTRLRITYIEDNALDVELVRSRLAAEDLACDIAHFENHADFTASLRTCPPDLILSDYTIPGYGGLDALDDAREICPGIPFVFVSGTIGEERAIESLRRGATDYVLKDNLSRLAPVLRRALREHEEEVRRRRAEEKVRQNEQRFASFMRNLPGVAFIKDKDTRYVFANERITDFLGLDPVDCLGRMDTELLPPPLAERMRLSDVMVLRDRVMAQGVEDIRLPDGERRWFLTRFPIADKYGTANWIGGIGIEVGQRM